MKRLISVVVASLTSVAVLGMASAQAEEAMSASHASGGVGFHNSSAPLGVRWWLGGQNVGIDAGFGFGSDPAPLYPTEHVSNWTIAVGIPYIIKSWDRAHVILRPGLIYGSQQQVTTAPPAAFGTDNEKTFTLTGEIEAEVFLVDNVSVSASEGIGYNSVNPPGPGDNITSFSTLGRNFTEIGFHIYFLGGK